MAVQPRPRPRRWSGSFETFDSTAKPLTFGLGYRYARRELGNGLSGNLNQVQFSAQYNF